MTLIVYQNNDPAYTEDAQSTPDDLHLLFYLSSSIECKHGTNYQAKTTLSSLYKKHENQIRHTVRHLDELSMLYTDTYINQRIIRLFVGDVSRFTHIRFIP